MHPNPIFRRADGAHAIRLIQNRSFGQVTALVTGKLHAAHVPVLLSEDGRSLDMHLVRSNPIARALGHPLEALVTITGADGYVSPDWYGVDDQVPTWNYTAVELRGTLTQLDQSKMRDMLDRQSAHFEAQLPKPPWTTHKMTPEVLKKMMRQIVPVRMTISDMQSTFKLSQNNPDDVRRRAADALQASGIGVQTAALAAMMRHLPE